MIRRILVVVLGITWFAEDTQALEIVDYNTGSSFSGFSASGGSSLSDPTFLGGIVELSFQRETGVGNVGFSASNGDSNTLPGEVLLVNALAYNTASFRHVFDGDGNGQFTPDGLGGVDLTDGGTSDGVLVDVLFSDVPSTLTYTVYYGSGQTSIGVLDLPGAQLGPTTSTTTVSLPFSAFSGTPDFTDVGALVIEGALPAGSDIILDNFRTGEVQANPVTPAAANVSPLVPLPANALIIDRFEDGTFGAAASSAPISSSSNTSGPSILGGRVLSRASGGMIGDPGSNGDGRVAIGRSNGTFDNEEAYIMSDAISTDVNLTFSYDGDSDFTFDPDGLGSVDLTDGGSKSALVLGVAFNDVPFSATIDVFSNGGVDQATYVLDVPGLLLDGASLVMPYADFVGTVDFADVSGVRIELISEYGLDVRLDYLAAVPEPTALALLLLGSAAILGFRRPKRLTAS